MSLNGKSGLAKTGLAPTPMLTRSRIMYPLDVFPHAIVLYLNNSTVLIIPLA